MSPHFLWTDDLYCYTKIYDSLTPITRICIDLRIEGKPPSHIAKRLKIPQNTIKSCLQRARKRYEKAILGHKSLTGCISNSEATNNYEYI